MLAGVDYVLMGAGIPAHIPALLNELAGHEVASLPVDVAEALPDETWAVTIDPREVMAASSCRRCIGRRSSRSSPTTCSRSTSPATR